MNEINELLEKKIITKTESEFLKEPIFPEFGSAISNWENLCKHCIRNGHIIKAINDFNKFQNELYALAQSFIYIRNEILCRPVKITRMLSCEDGHKQIYIETYGNDWEKHYTPQSAHLFGLGIDYIVNNGSERRKLIVHLDADLGITRVGFTRNARGLFHHDLWHIAEYQQKHLGGVKVARDASWTY